MASDQASVVSVASMTFVQVFKVFLIFIDIFVIVWVDLDTSFCVIWMWVLILSDNDFHKSNLYLDSDMD